MPDKSGDEIAALIMCSEVAALSIPEVYPFMVCFVRAARQIRDGTLLVCIDFDAVCFRQAAFLFSTF